MRVFPIAKQTWVDTKPGSQYNATFCFTNAHLEVTSQKGQDYVHLVFE